MQRHRRSPAPWAVHAAFVFAIAVASVFAIPAALVLAAPGDSTGDRVYGHNGSFTHWQCNSSAAGGLNAKSLCTPYDVAWESKTNTDRVFVADYGNHRVVQYDATATAAAKVFGQGASFTTNTCNNGGISADSLCGPYSVALDTGGNMYVAEVYNNRVLEFDDPLGTCSTCDTTADRVFGQPNFTSGTCNNSGISATSLCWPFGIDVDKTTGALYVADNNNNRVLEYDEPVGSCSTCDTTADRVYGQGGSFTSNVSNLGGVTADSLSTPYHVAIDGIGDVYIADTSNGRVLRYAGTSTTAVQAFGTGGSLTATGIATPVNGDAMHAPVGLFAPCDEGRLFVADTGIERTVAYKWPKFDTTADEIIGLPNMTATSVGGFNASVHGDPYGIDMDGDPNEFNVYIADPGLSRVVEYDDPFQGCPPPNTPTPTLTPTPDTPTNTPTATNTPTEPPTSTPTNTPILSTATVITTTGGTISFPGNNSSAAFASGAVPGDTLISVEVYHPSDAPAAPAGRRVLTVMYIGPEGLGPGNPMTVTLPWTLAELGDAAPGSLEIARFIGGTWQSLGGTTDELNGTTSVTTPFGFPDVHPQVSKYALLAPSSVGGIAEPPPIEGLATRQAVPVDDDDSTQNRWLVLSAIAATLAGVAGIAVHRRRR